MKILMVCFGNICRSPLAEGVLKHKAQQAGLNWEIQSAGTGAYDPGCAPHPYSQKIASSFGVDISAQQCRQFVENDMEHFDKIYVMDQNNLDTVKRLSRDKWDAAKVSLLMDEVYPGEGRIVPDPFTGGEEGYGRVYKLIEEACDAIVGKYSIKEAIK